MVMVVDTICLIDWIKREASKQNSHRPNQLEIGNQKKSKKRMINAKTRLFVCCPIQFECFFLYYSYFGSYDYQMTQLTKKKI